MVNDLINILWFTADYFIDVDRQLVPFIRDCYGVNVRWIVLQSLNGAKVEPSSDYDIINYQYRGKDPRNLFALNSIYRKIDCSKFDMVYSDSLGIWHYTALLHNVGNVPVVHAAHNVNPYPVWGKWLRMEVKYIFHRCQHFQMFSKHTARWFKEHYPTKSFFYAPMVVKDFGNVRTDNYKFDETKVNLLFFGNIVGNKRLDLLIDAVTSLPENVQHKIHLNICGKCRMDEEAFIKQIGNCKAISTYFKRIPDDEIPELFSKSQYLMLPYQDVAQSGPHMIAYNYNLPVIASDIPGFAERVDNGKNGFLFHVDDKLALMDAITKATQLSSEQYQDLKKSLADKVRDTYSLEAVSKRYIEYFNSIIK